MSSAGPRPVFKYLLFGDETQVAAARRSEVLGSFVK